jgi:hypothetical protein
LNKGEPNARAGALDVWIEQERQLITHYEARAARAEATAAAAITAALAVAALTIGSIKANDVDKTLAWIVVGLLALVCFSALVVRTIAGLRHTDNSLFSSGSDRFDDALEKLRECDRANPDPLDVRQRTLELCIRRSEDAHKSAKAKDLVAALASIALAFALLAILVLQSAA